MSYQTGTTNTIFDKYDNDIIFCTHLSHHFECIKKKLSAEYHVTNFAVYSF